MLPEEEKLDEVVRVIKENLPEQNYIVLKYLMMFLVEVSVPQAVLSLNCFCRTVDDHLSKRFPFIPLQVMNNAHLNKMNASNLAIVFGPNLIWPQSAAASLSAMGPINSITKIIIENVPAIFD